MNRIFFTLSLFLLVSITFATTISDSLEFELTKPVSKTIKLKLLNELAFHLRESSPERSNEYATQALAVAKMLHSSREEALALTTLGQAHYKDREFSQAVRYFQKSLVILEGLDLPLERANTNADLGRSLAELSKLSEAIVVSKQAFWQYRNLGENYLTAKVSNAIGYRYWELSEYDSALVYYHHSLLLRKKLPNNRDLAITMNNIGIIHYHLGDFERALEYYFKALRLQKEIQNESGISLVLSNIGRAFKDWGKYDDALFHFNEALTLGQSSGDNIAIAYSYNNIGSIYEQMGKHDSALVCYKKSLEKYTIEDDILGILLNLNSIGNNYVFLGDQVSALQYLQSAYELADSVGNPFALASSLKNMGLVYRNLNENETALEYFEGSMKIFKDLGQGDMLKDVYNHISAIYSSLGEDSNSLMYFRLFVTLKDSLYGEQTKQNINRLKLEYEAENIENENIVLRQKEQQQKIIINRNKSIIIIVSIGFVLLVMLSVVLYVLNINRKKANYLLIQSELKYRELAAALSESDNMRELLLDIITHDLRNPAGVIYGMSDMAHTKMPENKLIEHIHSSSQRLMKVLENTSILSQAVFGEKIDKEEIDLKKMLSAQMNDNLPALHEAGMDLELNFQDNIFIQANPIISQVFKNFISNAIKYAREGKKILIEAVEENDAVLIAVKDYGETIPEEVRQKIFDRTYQIENGKSEGRGLGLAIVKRIAAAHDGEAWVEPNSPRGNSFCIRIPRQKH